MHLLARIDSPVISTNFRSSTWILSGGLIFQLLAWALSLRIAMSLTIGLILFRIVPAMMVACGVSHNSMLGNVVPGRRSAMFPKRDGSPGLKPGAEGIVVFIFGVKVSHPLGVFAPGMKAAGDLFFSLIKDLDDHAPENGWLGGSFVNGHPSSPTSTGHLSVIGYFRNFNDLQVWAHGPAHWEAWNWWNANIKRWPHIGAYHEAFDVPAHHWETLYIQAPKIGLGQCKVQKEDGRWEGLLVDAAKGVWRTPAGRMGREAGKIYDTAKP